MMPTTCRTERLRHTGSNFRPRSECTIPVKAYRNQTWRNIISPLFDDFPNKASIYPICSNIFPLFSRWCSTVFLWFSYDFPMIFLWFPYDFPMISLMIFIWLYYDFPYDFPMIFLWFPYDFLWFSHVSDVPATLDSPFLPCRQAAGRRTSSPSVWGPMGS